MTAASIALPPSCSTLSPAAEASGWLVAIIPLVPSTTERVAFGRAAGRSPGPWASMPANVSVTAAATPSVKSVGFMNAILPMKKRRVRSMVRRSAVR